MKWFAEYYATENLIYTPVNLRGVTWGKCYSSTMNRAINTASHIYPAEIVQLPDLQELNILHRLPISQDCHSSFGA